MTEPVSVFLTPWSSFYVMTGSAAAALTGLMFVVITLVTGSRLQQGPDGISIYSTPTVVHFSMSLFVSAVLIAPWTHPGYPALLLGVVALYAVAYALRVTLRSRHLAYSPDLEDMTWHSILPLVAYAAILAGAILLLVAPQKALFATAGSVVLLIFIGIHNAWDVVTWITVHDPSPGESDPPGTSSR